MSRNLFVLLALLFLTSCTYSRSFNCPDARGARCRMLSEIDQRVSSGEIEEVYRKKDCYFGNCNKDRYKRPALQGGEVMRAKLLKESEISEYEDDKGYLYVK